ncbi:MAG: GNAT family N-acetyltransferase, partial [bacterium]
MVVITPQDAAERFPSVFKGRKWLFHLAAWLTGIDKVNAVHDRVDKAGTPYGPAFAKALMEDIEIDFRIGHAERLSNLPEGPFIVIANHVYGHIDGISLLDIFGERRPATKVMVNEMLTWIPG